MSKHILIIDNYDSFVYTIVGYLEELGARTHVVRNDVPISETEWSSFDAVLISPGPGTPDRAGQSLEIIARCAAEARPMLGVCLGHQALAEAFGATVGHAPELMHGKTSEINHNGVGVFAGLESPLAVTRYHSLAVVPQTVPDVLKVTASTASGIVMALEHRELPLHGVQFHPESVLTKGGYRMLANWLEICGVTDAVARSVGLDPIS